MLRFAQHDNGVSETDYNQVGRRIGLGVVVFLRKIKSEIW